MSNLERKQTMSLSLVSLIRQNCTSVGILKKFCNLVVLKSNRSWEGSCICYVALVTFALLLFWAFRKAG